MQMYWYGPHMGGWGWAMALGSVVFWVLLAGAIVALAGFFIRGGRRPLPPYQGHAGAPGSYGQPGPGAGYQAAAPEQVLAERFARGEIDEEEFRRRMAALRAEATAHHSPGART